MVIVVIIALVVLGICLFPKIEKIVLKNSETFNKAISEVENRVEPYITENYEFMMFSAFPIDTHKLLQLPHAEYAQMNRANNEFDYNVYVEIYYDTLLDYVKTNTAEYLMTGNPERKAYLEWLLIIQIFGIDIKKTPNPVIENNIDYIIENWEEKLGKVMIRVPIPSSYKGDKKNELVKELNRRKSQK